jgi:4-hydroxy-tetrahydrodipicolinate synthase
MLKPSGIIPAMITPMNEDQTVNEVALRQLVHRFLNAGVHGLFCLGTNGEFFSLTADEKVRIASIIVQETAGRVPVYAGSGAISTQETAELSRKMEEAGVSALSVITPYFNAISQHELIRHFETVAAAVSLPVLLYNIPARTGNSLEPRTVAALSTVPNIVGIKDSSGSFDNTLQYIEMVDSEFAVLAGTDSLILWTLMAGGTGAIAATANVFPELVVSIYEHWRNGELGQGMTAQKKLRAIRSALQKATLPSALKEALALLGFPAGPPRNPVLPVDGQTRSELADVLEQYAQLGIRR